MIKLLISFDNLSITGDGIVLLKICENKALALNFNDSIFLVIILASLVLLFYLKRELLKNMIVKSIIFIILIFVLVFIFSYLCQLFTINGCACKLEFTKTEQKQFISYKNKVIIVGDSRMSLIADNSHLYDIPKNYSFIAKSGAKIDWFINEAIFELEDRIKSKDYIYHVVINMGVNDMIQVNDAKAVADEYFKYYKKLKLKYPYVKIYLLSVNPISKKLLNIYWKNLGITNENIELYNNKLLNDINNFNADLFTFCDSYNDVYFNTYDGLHYKKDTSQDIINYINKRCIDYK